MLADVPGQFRIAGILPEFCYYKQGAAIISELLAKGSVSKKAYYALAGSEIGRILLEADVFSFYYDSSRISFQSALMRRFCEEIPEWK